MLWSALWKILYLARRGTTAGLVLTAASTLVACSDGQASVSGDYGEQVAALRGGNGGSPGTIPVHAHPNGKSYEEWIEIYFQQLMQIPLLSNPLFNSAKCSAGGLDGVTFFGGSPGVATRPCTAEVGQKILFPINAYLNDYDCPLDPDFQPEEGQSLEEFLTEGAEDVIASVTDVFVVVDGKPIPRLFDNSKVTTHLFTFTGDPSLSFVDPCITPDSTMKSAVAAGYWVMLEPLPPGEHTILVGSVVGGAVVQTLITLTVTHH